MKSQDLTTYNTQHEEKQKFPSEILFQDQICFVALEKLMNIYEVQQ